MTTEASGVPGVVLAGGLARRMGGGDKPLREIGGRTILARVVERLAPQCERLLLNANGDPARFASFGLPVIADGSGIIRDRWLESSPRSIGPRPTGLLPNGFSPRRATALFCPGIWSHACARACWLKGAELAVAASKGRCHPVIGLWSVSLRDALRQALVVEGVRKVTEWTGRCRVATVAWAAEPLDPFFNANTVDDLAEAERLAAIEAELIREEMSDNAPRHGRLMRHLPAR